MAGLKWEDKFTVGIKAIDDDHKKLIQLMVDLWDSIEMGKGRTIIVDVLQKLLDYTRTHFTDEEKIMIANNYPDYDQHKTDHDRFVNEVMNAAKDYIEKRAIPTQKILTFLARWLMGHILVYDKNLGKFLTAKGLK
jgi:hemerythrin